MSREIRRVPPGWQHPSTNVFNPRLGRVVKQFQPMHDTPFEQKAREWLDAAIAWDRDSENPDKAAHPFYWQWEGMPSDPKYYRPEWTAEPTHYQMYETVTEGTPVSPVFATKQELIDFLVEHGEQYDDGTSSEKWTRTAATHFVEQEWAPSLIVTPAGVFRPRDGDPF